MAREPKTLDAKLRKNEQIDYRLAYIQAKKDLAIQCSINAKYAKDVADQGTLMMMMEYIISSNSKLIDDLLTRLMHYNTKQVPLPEIKELRELIKIFKEKK